jgi:sirohydrochlorin ferrochelatase
LADPTIAVGIERLAARGVRRVIVVPLVLFAAGHAKRDVPEAVGAAASQYRVEWRQAEHLGLHPRMVELSTLRYDETVAGLPPVAAAETLLIVVGRGSSDPAATVETQALAELCSAAGRAARVETAFLALCEPRLDDVLRWAAEAGCFRRVVVQPHLLFRGEMLQAVDSRVAAARSRRPDIDWHVTSHLGVHRLLLEALVERIDAARIAGPAR